MTQPTQHIAPGIVLTPTRRRAAGRPAAVAHPRPARGGEPGLAASVVRGIAVAWSFRSRRPVAAGCQRGYGEVDGQ
ncbi:hypothetical protein ACIQBJ_08795 [Kitasatospora sp. NPDC088391]|uniref:hypothetical protein n=1 Tax=Kitasatospora sp. NPDC088391 TaxID=3364074 RepID=UPI00380D93DC